MKTTKIQIKEYSASEITAKALEMLKREGFECWRQHNAAPNRGRKYQVKNGLPDIIGWMGLHETSPWQGCFMACEVKKIGDRLSGEQKEFLSNLKKAGGIALVARQVGNDVVLMPF